MTDAALFRWPAAARFGRVVPKTKFYEHASASTSLRERFVADVQRITWAYKLADETIHLRSDATVPEIQVFAIDAKGDDVGDNVLTAIDKAVPFPIIFEVHRGKGERARARMTAAHKRLGGTTPRLSGYFSTGWQDADAARIPLPPAIDLPALYAALLARILPIAARPGETVSAAIGRMEEARRLEREITALEQHLRAEPQFNRKVEVRRRLRDRTAALAALTALTDPAVPTIEEAPWTS